MKKLVDKGMITVRPLPGVSNQEIYDMLYEYYKLEEKVKSLMVYTIVTCKNPYIMKENFDIRMLPQLNKTVFLSKEDANKNLSRVTIECRNCK